MATDTIKLMPASYEERKENHPKVASLLRELSKKVAMDLIVHTRPMHDAFIRLDSMLVVDYILLVKSTCPSAPGRGHRIRRLP